MTATVTPDWLTLREPADAAARSAELAARLGRHRVIHDLGGGSGAMGRWLAPRLPGPQHWVVHDRDPALLELVDIPAATVETRLSRHRRLTAGRSRRRHPRHRLGAARPADRGRAGPDAAPPAPGFRCC